MAAVSAAWAVADVAAAADDFCSELTRVGNEAQDRFRKFRAGHDGTGDYASSVTLPGADECYIDRADGEFICLWRLGISSSAEDEAKTFADGIAKCYPKAVRRSSTVTRIALFEYTVSGVVFRVGADTKRNKVRLGVERDH